VKYLARVGLAFIVVLASSPAAFATSFGVGLLTYDALTPSALATFDITNLTGANALPPDFPITTPLTLAVTNLVAHLVGGSTLTIDGSNFTDDGFGDLNCTVSGDAASGGCDLAAYSILSATLTGTFSPTTGLDVDGLPPGSTTIGAAFSTTVTPDAACGNERILTAGCDAAEIFAATPTAVPEPATLTLLEFGVLGLAARYRLTGRERLKAWFKARRS